MFTPKSIQPLVDQYLRSAQVDIFRPCKIVAQLFQNSRLNDSGMLVELIGYTAERHKRIARNVAPRKLFLKDVFDSLFQKEVLVGHLVAHLNKVLDGHVRDGITIGLSRLEKRLKGLSEIRVTLQQAVEYFAIFEAAIHSLAKKRHDRVSGVA